MSNDLLTRPHLEVDTEELIRQRAKLLPPYKVILFNDDYNEMLYVVAVLLRTIDNLSQQEAEQIMLTAHLTGSAVVVVCPKETAEYYQERLLSYGLTATIEPDA
jgi:ATP-dependent Clp protease adaptor protein ClpS